MRTSILPAGVVLAGQIRGAGDLVVRGAIEGDVDLDGLLTIDTGGSIRGEIRARAMVVRGAVEGPVTVLELLRLEPGARVLGDVQADRVSAATGSVMRGRVRMTGADRLRRTAGGTLTAPFTSSGSIEAPRERAQPIQPDRLSALAEVSAIRERTTELPEDRGRREAMRERSTDPAQARPRAVERPVEPAMPVAPPAPPPPVVPRLGRIRSRRHKDTP